MRILDWVFAIILCALGVVHSAYTLVIYHKLSLGALWFFSAGLALIFAGMINVLRLHGPASPLLRTFAAIANAALLAFALLFAFTAGLSHNPQGTVLIVALAGELLFSFSRKR